MSEIANLCEVRFAALCIEARGNELVTFHGHTAVSPELPTTFSRALQPAGDENR